MIRILITGGCGFIGSNLVEYLLTNTDWNINVLDNLSSGRLENIQHLKDYDKRVSFYEGDIVNINDIRNSIKKCNYVVNLAAQTSIIESKEDPIRDEEINIRGLLNTLKASVENRITTFVQASSAAVLGEKEMPINELKIAKPISPYGVSKLAGEAYIFAFYKCFGLKGIVLRFSNVYGPKSGNKGSVIARFIKLIIKGQDLTIYGDGSQTRDFIHVNDICRGIFLSLISSFQYYDIFHLGTGKETSINLLVNQLSKLAIHFSLKMPKIRYLEFREGEILRSYTDISKAKRVLGFNYKYTLNDGLINTLEWYLNCSI